MDKKETNLENFKSELIDVLKSYTDDEWYRLFLVIFLNSKNEEMDDIHTKILNSCNDAFAIASVKKRYESGETHKRLW